MVSVIVQDGVFCVFKAIIGIIHFALSSDVGKDHSVHVSRRQKHGCKGMNSSDFQDLDETFSFVQR